MIVQSSNLPRSRGRVSQTDTFHCGPVVIHVIAETNEWRELAASMLDTYAVYAGIKPQATTIHIRVSDSPLPTAAGTFLRTRNVHVDKTDAGIVATCRSGTSASSNAALDDWYVDVPVRAVDDHRRAMVADMLDLYELVLTTAWRRAGWIPMHAAAVAKADLCAILAAPSRGGKTTLTVAMLSYGWSTLGDDGLLVRRVGEDRGEVWSLHDRMNLDPQTQKWFPEVGNLSQFPPYSIWSDKRRVEVETIWQGRVCSRAQPTHLVQIERYPDHRMTRTQPLGQSQVLSVLLSQTVIPQDRTEAKQILSVLASLARQVRGVRLELGEDAYSHSETRHILERMLE